MLIRKINITQNFSATRGSCVHMVLIDWLLLALELARYTLQFYVRVPFVATCFSLA